jgi:hypothetical protein
MKKQQFGVFPKNDPVVRAKRLIDRAFNDKGYLINPESKTNQQNAKNLLREFDFGYLIYKGYEIHISLTVIANPYSSI